MTTQKVSVVIPVYNVEPYIEECVRTLFAQTLKDMEYIFVDDCSPDKSLQVMKRVLEEFPDRKSQVKVIKHEKNQGVAAARQHGADAATGEFIIHCDPDDWVELNMYEAMYAEAKASGADIVGCDFVAESPDGQSIVRQRLKGNGEEIVAKMLSGEIHSSLCCRLVKRRLVDEADARFLPDITYLEDMHYAVSLHWACEKVAYIPEPFYHYRTVGASITHTASLKHINSAVAVIQKLRKYADNNPKIQASWQTAYCRALQNTITHPSTYDPARWRREVGHFPNPYFGSIRNRLSPWLVKHHLDALNLLIIKFYRRRSK